MNALIKSSPAHKQQGALRWVLTKKKKAKEEKRKHVTNLGSYSHLLKPGASPTRLTLPQPAPAAARAGCGRKGAGYPGPHRRGHRLAGKGTGTRP